METGDADTRCEVENPLISFKGHNNNNIFNS